MKLVITEKENRVLSLLFDDKRLCDIRAVRSDGSIRGNIYRARVTKVVKHMDACFVDIAKGQTCFLKFSECTQGIPKAGDEITVMVTEDAIKTKLPSASMRLSSAGKYMIAMNDTHTVNVSRKITSRAERDRLHDILSSAAEENNFGVIVRTCAMDVDGDALLDEYRSLCSVLSDIEKYGANRTLYSVLHRSRPEYIDGLISHLAADGLEIVTDSIRIFEDITEFVKNDPEEKRPDIRLYADEMVSLYSLYSIEARIQELLSRRVYLKSGGYLVIEQTEALNVIDVNSGKFERAAGSEEFYSMTNKEAAAEAARQIKLRNLSGIIIIDFINETADGSKDRLIELMAGELKGDNAHARVVDITPLGLMEITRKKISPSLKEIFNT